MDQQVAGWEAKAVCPSPVVVVFTRQLAMMLANGIPITHALDILCHQEECPNFGAVVAQVSKRLAEGHTFSRELKRYPRIFSELYTSMVEVGEATGSLTDSLERLADWMERDGLLFHKVKSALTYPAFVIAISSVLTLLLFYTIMPKFVSIFESMHIPLPFLTRMMMVLTNLVVNPGAWCVGLAALLAAGAYLQSMWSSESGAVRLYGLLMRLPLVGRMLTCASAARFLAAMEISLDTGVDIVRTVLLGSRASGNPVMRFDASRLTEAMKHGHAVSEAMSERADLYPPTMTTLLRAGEESGDLVPTLSTAGRFFTSELDHLVDTLGSVLEPLLLVLVASVVVVALLSIFLPLYSYIGSLG